MKKVSFNDKVKIYKFDDHNNTVVETIHMQSELTLEQQFKVNFHYLIIFSIFNNDISSIKTKTSWWLYLKKHNDPLESRIQYYKNMIRCLYKLCETGTYRMSLYYNNHLLPQHLPYYCEWLNEITLLGKYANKIIRFYRKYHN